MTPTLMIEEIKKSIFTVKFKKKWKTVWRPSKLEAQLSTLANFMIEDQRDSIDKHIMDTILYWESELELLK